MDNNLGFKLKRRRGLVIETLHLDEGGGTSERRTTPSETQLEINKTPQITGGSHSHGSVQHSHAPLQVEPESKEKPAKKKLERRKIRFDDDPNENPSGILGAKTSPAPAANKFQSSLRTDKPELYDF